LLEGDLDYSIRWGLIKRGFTRRIQNSIDLPERVASRERHREATVCQQRFWEHRVRDERDFEVHCDYPHYNPVKHGLAPAPSHWPFSTFHRFVGRGLYSANWGGVPPAIPDGVGCE
jgi:putative transposase